MIIDFEKIVRENNIPIRGIIHIGACMGEEKPLYDKFTDNVVWIEANPLLIPLILKNVHHQLVLNYAICDKDGEANFNLIYSDDRTNPGCSSLLNLKEHAKLYPMIKKVGETKVKTRTLDTLLKEKNLKGESYNFLVMDAQGSELSILLGATEYLKTVDVVYTEFAIAELYQWGCQLKDLDAFLNLLGFTRVETEFAHETWGDCIFLRNQV